MRAESNIKPPAFKVEQCGDIAEVIMYENIAQEEREGDTVYIYDEHRINVPWRESLADAVRVNKAKWLQAAKAAENHNPPPTLAEEVEALKVENAALRVENQITGAAVEELITMFLGGSE